MGSDVQAEVPGVMVVSSSSDLDYLLWATTLFGSIYVIMYIFRILLIFFGSVVISTKLFMRTFIFFLDALASLDLKLSVSNTYFFRFSRKSSNSSNCSNSSDSSNSSKSCD